MSFTYLWPPQGEEATDDIWPIISLQWDFLQDVL